MDPWHVLGVEPGADPAAIHAAYRRLAWRHHPDRGGSTARMGELNAAYTALRRATGGRPAAASGQARSARSAAQPDRAAGSPSPAGRVPDRAAVWLVASGPGQWLGCLLLVAVVHGIALVGTAGAWSPLELLAALLLLRLHAHAVPDARAYAPAEAARALVIALIRAMAWLVGRW